MAGTSFSLGFFNLQTLQFSIEGKERFRLHANQDPSSNSPCSMKGRQKKKDSKSFVHRSKPLDKVQN